MVHNVERIMDIPAGRKLDGLIAEAVMGIDIVSKNHPCGKDPECGNYKASHFLPATQSWWTEKDIVYMPEWGLYPPEKTDEGDEYCFVEPVPFYSTDIAEAFKVVENMKSSFGADSMELIAYGKDYWCWFRKGIEDGAGTVKYIGKANGNTPALAICRAALAAALYPDAYILLYGKK